MIGDVALQVLAGLIGGHNIYFGVSRCDFGARALRLATHTALRDAEERAASCEEVEL